MATVCKQCEAAVTGIEKMVCRGNCGAVFHRSCIPGLKRSSLDIITAYKDNLFWLCDQCADNFTNWLQQPATAAPAADTTQLCDAVKKLNEVVSNLSSRIESIPSGSAMPTQRSLITQRQSGDKPTPKRSRENYAKFRAASAAICGTRTIQRDIRTVADEREQLWVYLSRFDPSHTVEDIAAIAMECLRLDESPKTVLLVKKDADLSKMVFVSFRVEVPKELKDAALSAATWPKGVLVREFDFAQGRSNRFPQ